MNKPVSMIKPDLIVVWDYPKLVKKVSQKFPKWTNIDPKMSKEKRLKIVDFKPLNKLILQVKLIF